MIVICQCAAARRVVAAYAEPPGGPGGQGKGSVVCLGDAFDDSQTEADACVVGVCAFGATKERLDKGGNYLRVSFLPVFSTVSTAVLG